MSLILVVFMLQKREELRNRMIRLMGDGHIVLATKFVDEAAQRISRFLLLQAIVNGTFGLILASGLLALGVRYAILWGFLAALLRYLPYIGPYLAAVLPISLSLAMFDGWSTTLLVIGPVRGAGAGRRQLDRALALRSEHGRLRDRPPDLGRVLGVSVGTDRTGAFEPAHGLSGDARPLRTAAPILERSFGDEPALDAGVSFYQRLLARDQDEALDLVMERQKTAPPDEVYDSMLVPALSATKLCRATRTISASQTKTSSCNPSRRLSTTCATAQRTSKRDQDGDQEAKIEASSAQAIPIFGCPAHHRTDQIALAMLGNLLGSGPLAACA